MLISGILALSFTLDLLGDMLGNFPFFFLESSFLFIFSIEI